MRKIIRSELDRSLSFSDDSDKAIKDLAEMMAHWSGSWSIGIRCENISYYFTDPLSQEQIYYRITDGKVKGTIEELAGMTPKLDPLYFSSAAKFGYFVGDRTYAACVRRLGPSTILRVEDNGVISLIPYTSIYNTVPEEEYIQLPQAAALLRTIVYNAVATSLENLPALGTDKLYVLLSGGLDSSIVAHIVRDLKKNNYGPLSGIEVVYVTTANGEDIEYARYLAHAMGVELTEIKAWEYDDSVLREAMTIADSPIDLGSLMPNYQLFKECGIRARIITGDGPDELLGGYARMLEYDSQHSDVFQELVYYHFPKLNATTKYFNQMLFCPYLNMSVIDFALAMPRELRTDKKVLREAFRGFLPDEIINRPKYALKSDGPREGRLVYLRHCLDVFSSMKNPSNQV